MGRSIRYTSSVSLVEWLVPCSPAGLVPSVAPVLKSVNAPTNQPFRPPYRPAPNVASLPLVVDELLEWLLECEWSTPDVPTSVIVGGPVGVTATLVPPTVTCAGCWFRVSSWVWRTCAAFAVLPSVGTNDRGTVTGTGVSVPNAPFGTGFGVRTFV